MSYPERSEITPPWLAERLLELFSWSDDRDAIVQNLRDEYRYLALSRGRSAARLWYRLHVLRSLIPFVRFSLTWSFVMMGNYSKIAFRNFMRYRVYSALNLAGLVVGLACSILIVFWVQDELGYDRFHEQSRRLHRVISNLWVQPAPLAPLLRQDYPEILDAVRILKRRALVRTEDRKFYEDQFSWADNSLFALFTLPFVWGEPETALSEPQTVVLTEDMALKYFGSRNALGSTIQVDNQFDMKVTGVIENPPANSTLQFSLIGSFPTLEKAGMNMRDWGNHLYDTFILLAENARASEVEKKIENVVKERLTAMKLDQGLSLQPLNRIHLYAEGRITSVYIFVSVAAFILLLAFINFINLSTARSEKRSLEVGVRKVSGASRTQLIHQFLGESLLFSAAAFLLAVVLSRLCLPLFNTLSGKHLNWGMTDKLPLLCGLLGVTLLAGAAAGSYPALVLSSFRPADVIRRLTRSGSARGGRLRRALVIFQFAISIFLIIATLAVESQLRFVRQKNMGYQKEHVLYLAMNEDVFQKRRSFLDELRRKPGVLYATTASSLPSNVSNTASGIDWEGNEGRKNASWRFVAVDYDYIETLGMEIREGRRFSRDFPTDLREGFIVNETAVREMEMEDPVGKWFSLWSNKGTIIGVVKDFHFRSLHSRITPLLLWMGARYAMFSEFALVRVAPGGLPGVIEEIEEVWNDFAPNFPFEYGFLDESYGRLYRAEERMGRVFGYFSFLAVFISCLGLFGLAAFTAEQKTKEIGIRKVFGASATGLAVMMSGAFSRWVLVANLIAWPAAYLFVERWMGGFAYRTRVSPMLYLLAALGALLVALLTVSFQSLKAAAADPVDSLRYE